MVLDEDGGGEFKLEFILVNRLQRHSGLNVYKKEEN